MMGINSRDYWEQRFGTDWDELGGPAQTRFFARLAIDAMPEWLSAQIRSEHLSICDWGCAEGEGTSLLAESLGTAVTGIDFSPEAIERAKSKFPGVEFSDVDLLTEQLDRRFDVMFSSNTLEHFHRPWEVFDAIAEHAGKHVMLLLPFRETDRHPEHFYGFDPHGVPAVRGDWVLTHVAVIDAAHIRESMWPGEQVLVIYSRRTEVERIGLSLAMMRMDTPHLERLRDQAASLSRVVSETRDAVSSDMRDHIGLVHSALIEAFSQDIRRMQDVVIATSERAAASDAKDELGRQLKAITEQMFVPASSMAALQERLDALTDDRNQLQLAVDAAEREVDSGRIAFQSMQLAFEESIGAQAKSTAELNAARSEVESLQHQVEAAHLEIEMAQQEIDTARHQIALTHGEMEMLRREHAALQDEKARLLEISRQFERVVSSRTWRWTRPLRVLLRLVSGRWTDSDRVRTNAALRSVVALLPFLGTERRMRWIARTLPKDGAPPSILPNQNMAASLPLVKRAPELPDVFVWSVIDWHFRVQRPQHLARALVREGHRVFYVSPNFAPSARPGFHLDPIDGCGRLYQVHLNLVGEPLIYHDMPTQEQVEMLRASLGELLAWTRTSSSVSLIQHPYWTALASAVPNARVIYDCMDHHAGFENNASAVLAGERSLVESADLVIVTSSWLEDELKSQARQIAVIRNAGDFEFFSDPPADVFRDEHGRRVIGYFGAIAAWFDPSLVRRVAETNPEALVVLVGHDSAGVGAQLTDLVNVRLVGEVPYAKLPYWLHSFDVCLLPFKILPLTLATNPVKLYEYLAAGKPVVAVDLPEMAQFDGLVRVASTPDDFALAVRAILTNPEAEAEARARREFAAKQTWLHRAEALDNEIRNLSEPRVSVIVLTYNNLAYTQACLSSLEAHSDYTNLEVIVVDNASSDGSIGFLEAWIAETSPAGHQRKLIANASNLGFAAGNNIGLAAASGEILVLLNNDTYVTPGWVRTLCSHLRRNKSLGLVGPVTNNIGNEARVEIVYSDMDQMIEVAGNRTRRLPGKEIPVQTAAFFCVAMPRVVYATVGSLDEAFGQGFFEDDDYCRRVQMAGWSIACAEDVFVHHHLSATFDQLKAEQRAALFERNKAIYEAKWGAWSPHAYRAAEKNL